LTYVAGLLAVVHYIWLVKQGVLDPWYFAAILLVLFILRLPTIKKALSSLRKRNLQRASH
jgi:DMSO/TMAO reductase YedYZ heme-binding membrane subunit